MRQLSRYRAGQLVRTATSCWGYHRHDRQLDTVGKLERDELVIHVLTRQLRSREVRSAKIP